MRVLRQHRMISLSECLERIACARGVAKGVTRERRSAYDGYELSWPAIRLRSVGRFVCRTARRVDRQGRGSSGTAPADGRRGRLIARYRRRRPTLAPGDASIQAPTCARGGERPSVRAPIYSGRAASASSRRSRYSHAAAAAVAGDHVAVRAARSPGDRNKAACRGLEAVREADTRAVRVGPRRCAANRRWRRRPRSVRWRATASVDSWRVLYLICNRAALR